MSDLRGSALEERVASIQRRKRVNSRVAYRLAHGLTQQQAADLFNEREAAAGGARVISHKQISYWEAWPARSGRTPSLDTLNRLAQVYRCRSTDLIDGEDHRCVVDPRGEATTPSPVGQDGQRAPVSTAHTSAVLLSEMLPDGDVLRPLTAVNGRRVGRSTVGDVAARVHRLRLADDVLAGGDLIGPAFRDLRAAITLYRESSHTEGIAKALLVQIGELAQIAGWIASDAGRHDLAERAYNLGVSAARQGEDATLAANLTGSLAYQYANTGRERRGVELARAALDEAGPRSPAKARALFFDRLAWAHARTGQAQAAIRALGEAHDALAQDGAAGDEPQWLYWVNDDELDVMDARVHTELHKPLRAVPLLSTILDRYDPTHTRELVLYLSWLAIAYADANEPEAAAVTAARMLDLSSGLASDRAATRTRIVLDRLAQFSDSPEVRTLADEWQRSGPAGDDE